MSMHREPATGMAVKTAFVDGWATEYAEQNEAAAEDATEAASEADTEAASEADTEAAELRPRQQLRPHKQQ